MRISARVFFALACALSLGLAACGKAGGQTGDEDALPDSDFYADLAKQQGMPDYQPASGLADLVARSQRIAVGHGVALSAGRTFKNRSGDVELRTTVLELAVERELKGTPADVLYLEFMDSSEDAKAPARVPADRVLVFAVPSILRIADSTIIDAMDLPAGAMRYALTTPQGLALAGKDGGFSQPFERDDGVLGKGSFDDLIERVAQAVMDEQDRDAALPGPDGSSGSGSLEDGGAIPGPDGSAEGDAATPTDAGAGACFGEGSDPCPAQCNQVRGTPYDEAKMCLDSSAPIQLGCTGGVGPPVVVCIERISDGARFSVGQGWNPSTLYRRCDDSTATTVLGAPTC